VREKGARRDAGGDDGACWRTPVQRVALQGDAALVSGATASKMPAGEAHTPTTKLSSKSTGKGGGVTRGDRTKGALSTGTERTLDIGRATSTKESAAALEDAIDRSKQPAPERMQTEKRQGNGEVGGGHFNDKLDGCNVRGFETEQGAKPTWEENAEIDSKVPREENMADCR
jgi:hypothetical protein